MRRAPQSPTATRTATSSARNPRRGSSLLADPPFANASISADDSSDDEVLLSPAGMFINNGVAKANARCTRSRELAIAIRQRIESRLQGRIRNLAVRILGDTVMLEGQCNTYYSKQLAQHAALAVLEHEHLENAIVVSLPG